MSTTKPANPLNHLVPIEIYWIKQRNERVKNSVKLSLKDLEQDEGAELRREMEAAYAHLTRCQTILEAAHANAIDADREQC